MQKIEGEIKLSKFDELLILILIYNTILRMSGFPEDYTLSEFSGSKWIAVLVVNCVAAIVFTIIILWEKWIEKKREKI